MRKKYSC